ncbi:MAG TPA: hypothetical protein VIF14_04385 [Alphaproteobacteria bacterium]|jgi:hypothetical protein
MRLITRPAWTAAPADGSGSEAELRTGRHVGARPRGTRRGSVWRARRALLATGEAAPTPDDRNYAAQQLRRAFVRIDRDFHEAYEQCRTDAQRRALEDIRRAAKTAYLRVQSEALLADREGWRRSEAAFGAERIRVERHLSGLATAAAVIRIRAKLVAIADHLAVLAA